MRADGRQAPLRRIVSSEGVGRAYRESLECGHVQYTKDGYRKKANNRRCKQCLEGKITKLPEPPPLYTVETVPEATDNVRCVYCHDDLDATAISCDQCHTLVHGECSTYLGRCPTLACPGSFRGGTRSVTRVDLTVQPRQAIRIPPRARTIKSTILAGLRYLWLAIHWLAWLIPRTFDRMVGDD